MKVLFYALILLTTMLNSNFTSAQTQTFYKDLSGRSDIPLYDCSIFARRNDQNLCDRLKSGRYMSFENGGYAVSCFNLDTRHRNNCLRLAEDLQFETDRRINCNNIYRDEISRRQCEITKLGYFEGRFHDRGHRKTTPTRSTTTTTTTTTVISDRPVYNSKTTCDVNSYNRAVDNWRIRKEEQRKKGQTRAAVGVIATIGGIILGNSNDRTVRTIGQGLTIGGVFLTTWGLVEMIDADITYPHMDPYCKTTWTQESRMVVIEEQQCMTTRHYDRNAYSSRYYYEVNCSNKRYVTFEEFRPWNEGRTVSYYNY